MRTSSSMRHTVSSLETRHIISINKIIRSTCACTTRSFPYCASLSANDGPHLYYTAFLCCWYALPVMQILFLLIICLACSGQHASTDDGPHLCLIASLCWDHCLWRKSCLCWWCTLLVAQISWSWTWVVLHSLFMVLICFPCNSYPTYTDDVPCL